MFEHLYIIHIHCEFSVNEIDTVHAHLDNYTNIEIMVMYIETHFSCVGFKLLEQLLFDCHMHV